jgi:hypothetical protein
MKKLRHDGALVTEVVENLGVDFAVGLPVGVDRLHCHGLTAQLA